MVQHLVLNNILSNWLSKKNNRAPRLQLNSKDALINLIFWFFCGWGGQVLCLLMWHLVNVYLCFLLVLKVTDI